MAVLPFDGNFPVTQWFNDPCCRDFYRLRFGSAGHDGIDFGLPCGTPLLAPDSGTVRLSSDPRGYGDNIQILVPDGSLWLLAHLSRFDVNDGAWVEAGQQIGLSGGYPGAPGAGTSTGCHLHLSYGPPGYLNSRGNGFGGMADPQPYLTGESVWMGQPSPDSGAGDVAEPLTRIAPIAAVLGVAAAGLFVVAAT